MILSYITPLSWNTGDGTWDTSTTNWLNSSLNTVAYEDGASPVLFDDATGASGNPTVTLDSAFSPLGVTMNSTLHDYTISGSGAISGSTQVMLAPANTKTLTLSTANTYTGATTVKGGTLVISGSPTGNSAVSVNTGGTLQLDYTTNGDSKIHDSAILTLGGGTIDLKGGTANTEIVASTTLTAGTASSVTRSTPGSVLQMGVITRNTGATISFGASNIATTSTPNTSGGILGAWATIGGTDWASNSGSPSAGPIIAYAAYTDLDAQAGGPGSSVIPNTSTANVRINTDGTSGNMTLGASDTTVNTILQNHATIAATIDTAGGILRTDGVMIGIGKEALTIGTGASPGTMSAVTAGGDLVLFNNSAGKVLTVNAPIIANGASGLITTGSVTLNGVNTYTGATTVVGGTLEIGGAGQLAGGTYAGAVTMGTGATLKYNSSASQSLGGIISGAGSLVKDTGAGTLTLTGANTYSGGTTVSTGTLIAQTTGASTNSLGTGAASIGGGTTLQLNNLQTSGTTAIGNAFTGSGRLIVNFAAGITARNTNITGVSGFNGTIELANAGANGDKWNLGDSGVNAPGATVQVDSGSTMYFPGGTTTFAGITVAGAGNTENRGAFRMSGSSILNGPVTLSGDATIASDSTATPPPTLTGDISATGANTLTIGHTSATGNITLNGVLSNGTGTLSLTKTTAGTLTLTGANTYTGGTTISGGGLSLTNLNAIQNTSSVAVASGATLQLSVAGTFANTAAVSIVGTGLTGTPNPGALSFRGNITCIWNAPLTLGGTTTISSYGSNSNTTLGGAIGGTGPLTINSKGGGATHTAVWTLNAQSNYTGATTILNSDGLLDVTVKLGIANALPTGTSLNLQATTAQATSVFTTLDLNGFSQTLAGLTDTGSSQSNTSNTVGKRVINSSVTLATLTINNSGADTYGTTGTGVLAGTIGGNTAGGAAANNLALAKTGAGALTLTGPNTYTGGTTISAGTLAIGSTGSLDNTAISVSNAGSTFAVQAGSGTVNLGTTVAGTAGATLNLGSGTTFSMVDAAIGKTNLQQQGSFAGTALTLNTATLNFELSGATADNLAVTGAASTVSVTGTNTINLTPLAALTAGTYNLIATTNPAGGLSTGGTFALANGLTTGAGTFGGSNYLLTLNNSAYLESVTVGAASAMTWTGQTAGNGATDASWNTTGSTNFALGTTPVGFINGNAVTFQDTNTVTAGNVGAPSLAVTIQAEGVSPGSTTFNNSAVNYTVSGGAIGGTGGLTVSGGGTVALSNANTYTGATTVSAGTLTLSGARTAAATGGFNVGNLAGSTGTLNVSNGTFTAGGSGSTFLVGNSGTGILNQSGGSLTTIGNQLLIGNGTNGTGTYNLSAGTLTTIAGSLGVTVGVNTGCTATFNLSDSGTLTMPATSTLQITRSDNSAASGVTGTFTQTGGTATVGILQMGGSNTTPASNANANATLNLSGGTFTVTTFNQLSGANTSTSTINIGGTAVVTLPAFPAARGAGSTATITFNGGTLKPAVASTTYMAGLTNAFIKAGGAKFDTDGKDITVTQNLLTDAVSTGGGLTKIGFGTLTLSGANTYTGDTTISGGVLTISNPYLDDASKVTISVVGGLNLDFAGSLVDLVGDLWLGGTQATPGTIYNLANGLGYITGTGNIKIASLAGDADGNGIVDAADYIAIKTNFGLTGVDATLAKGNVTGAMGAGGTVDWDDLQVLMAHFGTGSLSAPAMNTPEPATMGLLAVGALAMLRRRKAA